MLSLAIEMSNTLSNAGKPSHSLVAQGQNNSLHQCCRFIKFEPYNIFLLGGPGICLINFLIVRKLLLKSFKSLAVGKHLHFILWIFFTWEIVVNIHWGQLLGVSGTPFRFPAFWRIAHTFLCGWFTSLPDRSHLPHSDCWKLCSLWI